MEDLRVARSSINKDSLPSSNYPGIKSMTGKVVDPTAKPAIVILLNGHAEFAFKSFMLALMGLGSSQLGQ